MALVDAWMDVAVHQDTAFGYIVVNEEQRYILASFKVSPLPSLADPPTASPVLTPTPPSLPLSPPLPRPRTTRRTGSTTTSAAHRSPTGGPAPSTTPRCVRTGHTLPFISS